MPARFHTGTQISGAAADVVDIHLESAASQANKLTAGQSVSEEEKNHQLGQIHLVPGIKASQILFHFRDIPHGPSVVLEEFSQPLMPFRPMPSLVHSTFVYHFPFTLTALAIPLGRMLWEQINVALPSHLDADFRTQKAATGFPHSWVPSR